VLPEKQSRLGRGRTFFLDILFIELMTPLIKVFNPPCAAQGPESFLHDDTVPSMRLGASNLDLIGQRRYLPRSFSMSEGENSNVEVAIT